MSRIEDAVEQNEIAESILDAPIVGNHADPNWAIDTVADERAAEEWPNGFDGNVGEEHYEEGHGPKERPTDTEQAEKDDFQVQPPEFDEEHLAILQDAQAWKDQQQQPAEPTPQDVQTALGQLDHVVETFGVDQGAAKELAYSLTAPYGSDPSSVDANAMGRFSTKCTVSAVHMLAQSGGDQSQMAPMPDAVQRAVTSDFCRMFGIDARTVNVDSRTLSQTLQGAHLNMVQTALNRGLDRPVSDLTDPEAAELYVGYLAQSMGLPVPPREQCLQIADAYMGYVVNDLRRMHANHAQAQTQQRTTRPARNNNHRSASKFRTNSDLFDDQAIELYRREHGKL